MLTIEHSRAPQNQITDQGVLRIEKKVVLAVPRCLERQILQLGIADGLKKKVPGCVLEVSRGLKDQKMAR